MPIKFRRPQDYYWIAFGFAPPAALCFILAFDEPKKYNPNFQPWQFYALLGLGLVCTVGTVAFAWKGLTLWRRQIASRWQHPQDDPKPQAPTPGDATDPQVPRPGSTPEPGPEER